MYCSSSITGDVEFLKRIGYLAPDQGPFKCDVKNVDPEIGTISAPQLVAPLDNARFAINAANARWGSLLQNFYDSDVVAPLIPGFKL